MQNLYDRSSITLLYEPYDSRLTFPSSFNVPNSFDSKITSALINQIKQAFQEAVQKRSAPPYNYSPVTLDADKLARVLDVANTLKVGEVWIDVFYKLMKAYDSSPYSGYEYNSFDDYYLNYILKIEGAYAGLNNSIKCPKCGRYYIIAH